MKNFIFLVLSVFFVSSTSLANSLPVGTETNPVITVDLGDVSNFSEADFNRLKLSLTQDAEVLEGPVTLTLKATLAGTGDFSSVKVSITVTEDNLEMAATNAVSGLVAAKEDLHSDFDSKKDVEKGDRE